MGQGITRKLMAFAGSEARALLTIQKSDRPWHLPFAAAIVSGVPVAAGAYTGLTAAGKLGAVAALSFLYLPATGLQHRIPVIMACAFAMAASYAVGLATQFAPGLTVPLIGCVAAAAFIFCRVQKVIPPGPIFMVMTAAIGAYSPIPADGAVEALGYFVIGCMWACGVALFYSWAASLRRTPLPPPDTMQGPWRPLLLDAALVGFFVSLSLAIATLGGFEKPYWVPVSCLAIIQGVTLRSSWTRHVHRIVGTVLGIGVAWVMLPYMVNPWAVAIAVTALSFLIEAAVVRHYGFAAIFITPLTILLAETSASMAGGHGWLMEARLVDTAIGAAIGLIGAFCLHNERLKAYLEGRSRT